MIGKRFGRWVVTAVGAPQVFPTKTVPRWHCVCDCGTERLVTAVSLKNGRSSSCGCYNREVSSDTHRRHGMTNSPEYIAWQSMRQRALNLNNPRHRDYSDRGIGICSKWESFEAFFEDVGPRPSARHSIDRIDNDKGYSPENCRWALPHQQMVNRRCTRFIEYKGEIFPLATLANQFSVPKNTLRARIVELGWPVERALKAPVRPKSR